MTSSAFIASRAAAVVVVCALGWPGVASAQDDAFRRGLDARGNKDWKAVVVQMRAAIQSDGQESARRVRQGLLGLQGMEYLPHYFLGEALFNLQDCVGAVEAWAISEQHAVVRARGEFVMLIANGYKTCAARGVLAPSEYNTQFTATTQTVTEATAFAQRVSERGQQFIDVWGSQMNEQYARISTELTTAQARLSAGTRSRSAGDFAEARAAAGRASTGLRALDAALTGAIENLMVVRRQTREVDQLIAAAENGDRAIDTLNTELPPALATSRQSGRDLLARARERTRTGEKTQNLATVNEGLKSAQDAMAVFVEVLDQANKLVVAALGIRFKEVLAVATEAFSFLDNSIATLQGRVLGKVPPAAPEQTSQLEAFQKRSNTLRRRFDAAQKTQDLTSLQEAMRLAVTVRTEVDTVILGFGPQTLRDRGVRAALEDGARLFFAGDYQQVLTALDSNELTDAPLQLHVHLFRAAALYHLFVRSGEKDQALRARALAEIDTCRRLSPDFVPDAKAFAPRFILFFQDAGGPVTP